MLEIFFQIIPATLFEPIAAGAVPGIAAALIFGWKKRSAWYWILLFSILFMIGWRLAIQIVSSRYAAILIYPAIIFTAYFCFQTERLSVLFKQYRHGIFICRLVPWLLILGLSIVCIGKVLHYNPYSDYVIKTCKVFLDDTEEKEKVYVYSLGCGEKSRIIYYSGLKKMSDLPELCLKDPDKRKILADKLKEVRNVRGAHYFYATHKKTEPHYKASELHVSDDEWAELCAFYTSKRKKKELVLYKYTPKCPNVKEWKEALPALNPKKFPANAGFENVLTGKAWRNRKHWVAKQGLTCYQKEEVLLPLFWMPHLGKWNAKNPPVMILSDKNPLSGKYSFFVDTRHIGIKASFGSPEIPKLNGTYSGFVRGEGEYPAEIRVLPMYVDRVQKKTILFGDYHFFAEPGKVYHFSGEIKGDEMQNTKGFFLYFHVMGCATFDNIEIIPKDKN